MAKSNVPIKAVALELLLEEANKIESLIKAQAGSLNVSTCPVYEEVLDTHIYGFSKTVEFITRLNLVNEQEGKDLLADLEKKLQQHLTIA
ncbi:DUF1507 family protein [Desertibacillus haloalkaliphilus]|uniref:DUF1507 family protein n=1 Tax=Desertibacillus haloalkaliphilus TaxID=1328930 RepID=UPI001FE7842D|nr:DUF1507 family protein [Desertibacillus haloalkaliphilus]